MKKFLAIVIGIILLAFTIYVTVIYFATYSEGVRSGELIKFTKKGTLFKTWEGEISQGISGAQIFSFSVERENKKVIENLVKYQGNYVKVTYIERFDTFFWLGETNYYIKDIIKEQSPHFNQK
jgi:uncharacterized protein YxeA